MSLPGAAQPVRISLHQLRGKVHAYRDAARQWARRAASVARLTGGEDATALAAYEAALEHCWNAPVATANEPYTPDWIGGLGTGSTGRDTSFPVLWTDAGLTLALYG